MLVTPMDAISVNHKLGKIWEFLLTDFTSKTFLGLPTQFVMTAHVRDDSTAPLELGIAFSTLVVLEVLVDDEMLL